MRTVIGLLFSAVLAMVYVLVYFALPLAATFWLIKFVSGSM